ncbi:MAG TPA: LysE family translocator [Solirubrobacteraceae bacterium]|nr:LysE family translocator [Solirubrobacteraceae bacterium]
MLHTLLTFVPVAVLLSITPGAATALVVRNAARGGRRHAFFTTSGNSIGVLAWGGFAAVGIATLVATSAAVFDAVKLAGAAVLVVIGLRSLAGRRHDADAPGSPVTSRAMTVSGRAALREGLITSLANPKLAVFFVALFPQFIPHGAPVLPCALAMALVIVAVDLVWYSTLALLIARARDAFVAGGWGRRVERITGAVLIGLGIRLAFERR